MINILLMIYINQQSWFMIIETNDKYQYLFFSSFKISQLFITQEQEQELDTLIQQPVQNNQLQILPSYGCIQDLTEKNIGEYLNLADILYYGEAPQVKFNNIVYTSNQLLFTDQQYDYYVQKYNKQYIQSKTQIKSNVNRFLLQHPLMCGTLQKYYSKDMQKLLTKLSKSNDYEFVITPKFDGVSCRVYITRTVNKYNKDIFSIKIMNRSEKNFGKDITIQAQHLIEPYRFMLQQILVDNDLYQVVLRGELISKKLTRQDIAGLVSSQQRIDCDFVLYEFLMLNKFKQIIQTDYEYQLLIVNELQKVKNGYQTPYQIINPNQLNENVFRQFYDQHQEYYCDGVVIKANHYYETYDKEHPEQQVAFKFENAIFKVKVTRIEWFTQTNVSEDGSENGSALNCQLYFDPIYIGPDNTLVNPLTPGSKKYDHVRGYNPCWLIINQINIGSIINVQYSGGILLTICAQYKGKEAQEIFKQQNHSMKELLPFKPIKCPGCGKNVILDENHGDFICGSGLCQYLYIMNQMKNYYGFKGYAKKSIENDFQRIVYNVNPNEVFTHWFLVMRQKYQILRITLKEFLIFFIPTLGKKNIQQYITGQNIMNSIILLQNKFRQLNLDKFEIYIREFQRGENIQ